MFSSLRAAPVLAMAVSVMAGCSATSGQESEEQPRPSVSDEDARAAVFSSLRQRTENASSVYIADDLGDYLPTQMVEIEGESSYAVSPGIIIGAVTDAQVASAYKVGGEENPDGVAVAQDAPDADWRVLTVTLGVSDAWSNEVSAGEQVTFNMSVSGSENVDTFVQGLQSMDNAVIALDGSNQIGNAEYAVGDNGTLLGLTDGDGITFPALSPGQDQTFVGDLTTPAQLDEAAAEPQEPILVEDGVVVDPGD